MDRNEFFAEVNGIIRRHLAACRWIDYSANRLTREGARHYVAQHGIFTQHSRRAWAYVVAQCPQVDVRRFIVRENLYEEEGIEEQSHFLKLVKLAKAVGLTADEMNNAAPLPSTRVALLIWETLTKDRHWLIGCAAKATLEQMSAPEAGGAAQRNGEDWLRQLHITEDEAEFWLLHDELDQKHGSGAFDFVVDYLPRQNVVTRAQVMEAVEDSTFAWVLFWDGIAAAVEPNVATAA